MNIGGGHYTSIDPHTHTHTHTHGHAQWPLPFISAVSAWLAASGLFISFPDNEFVTKLPHTHNYFLQLSAFPKHLAAAQIMFALNTAQCRGTVSGAAEGRRLLLVQMSLSLWALLLSLYSPVFSLSLDYGCLCVACFLSVAGFTPASHGKVSRHDKLIRMGCGWQR